LTVDVEAAVRQLLIQDADIVAATGGRIYGDILPAGAATPALIYMEVSRHDQLAGDGPTGLVKVRMQLSAWSPDRGQALAIIERATEVLCPQLAPGQFSDRLVVLPNGLRVRVLSVLPDVQHSGANEEAELGTLFLRARDYFVSAASSA
jgi:Protein of unknown function (DUF3168)